VRAQHHEKYVQIITEAYFLRVETLMKNYPIAQKHVFMRVNTIMKITQQEHLKPNSKYIYI
jgi:hypothetical protein